MKKAFTFFLTALLLLSTQASAAVRAWLNQNTVYQGDPVTLTIEVDGQSAPRPDLKPLEKSFRILGTGTSTSVSIVNGRTSATKSWRITLQPLGMGKLTIPSISVGNEKTQPLTVTVTDVPEEVKAKLRDHVMLEASIDSDNEPVHVQQQITYTLRLLTDDDVISGELIAPQIENAVVEQIAPDRRETVVRNGKRYNLLERRYVISPERSGKLEIPPAQFRGKLKKPRKQRPQRRSRDPFEDFFGRDDFFRDPFSDDFFDDDFFAGTPFGPRGEPIRTSSNALSIEVLPVPQDFTGKHWLPAEEVKIQDSWRSHLPKFRVGEPVVRSLRFQIKGLAGSQLPPLEIPEPQGMRIYPDQAKTDTLTDGETVYGVSEQSITYIPNKTGKITIPEIRIDWWNTKTGKQETTTLPALTVEVEPGAGGKTTATPPPAASKAPAPATAEQKETASDEKAVASGLWPWLTALALLVIAGITWRWISLSRKAANRPTTTAEKTGATPPKPSPPNRRAARDALQRACESGNAREAARQLLKLAAAEWPDDPPQNLGALASRLDHGAEAVRELDRHLYGGSDEPWDGATLWRAVEAGLQAKQHPRQSDTTDDLHSLYPQRK